MGRPERENLVSKNLQCVLDAGLNSGFNTFLKGCVAC